MHVPCNPCPTDPTTFLHETDAKSGGAQAAKGARTYGGMAPDEALKVLNLQRTDLKDPKRILEVGEVG